MKLKPLCAWDELSVPLEVQKLLPLLLEKNLTLEAANALANNVVFLFFSLENKAIRQPTDILKGFSLKEIADLCATQNDYSEYGFNENFKEENL